MTDKQPKLNLKLLSQEQVVEVAKDILQKMEENKGMTLKEATGVSDETLEEVYSLAYTYYNQGRYEESVSLFEFLTGASPTEFKYVLGLAASYHQLKFYQEACVGFFFALQLEPENPIPAWYITDCFLKQEMKEEAGEFAQVTIEICAERPEHSELRERCELISKSLKLKK